MKKTPLFLSLAILLFISSCCRNVNTTCTNGNLNVFVTGFMESHLSASPLSSIPPYAIRYQQDNTFEIPIDTLMISHYKQDIDTFSLVFLKTKIVPGEVDSFGSGLILGYDYKIFFPADTLTYAITHLNATGSNQMELQKCGDKSPPRCYKNASSCDINGI